MLVEVTYLWVKWHWLKLQPMCRGSPMSSQGSEGFRGEVRESCPWPEPMHLPNFITVCFLVSWKYCPFSLLHQPNLELSPISSFTHRHAHTNTTYWRRPLCEHLSPLTRIEWLVLTHDLSCPNSSIKEENFFFYTRPRLCKSASV